MSKSVTEVHVYPGDEIRKIIQVALDNAPSFFNFNGLKIEVSEDMRDHPDAFVYLYDYYHCWIGEEPLPKWSPKGKEKPCKSCGRNNFIADKKCWWCETANPCT
jgi:hypothetical protein